MTPTLRFHRLLPLFFLSWLLLWQSPVPTQQGLFTSHETDTLSYSSVRNPSLLSAAKDARIDSHSLRIEGSTLFAGSLDMDISSLTLKDQKEIRHSSTHTDRKGVLVRTLSDIVSHDERSVKAEIKAGDIAINSQPLASKHIDTSSRLPAIDDFVFAPKSIYTDSYRYEHTHKSLTALGSLVVQALASSLGGFAGNLILDTALANTFTLSAVNAAASSAISQGMGMMLTGGDSGFDMASVIKSAISGALSYEIGHGAGKDWSFAQKSLAHGMVQGTLSSIEGGDFWGGFGAGVTGKITGKALMKAGLDGENIPKIATGSLITGVAGGVVSELSGGDFTTGALGASMVYLYNDLLRYNGKVLKHFDDDGKLLHTYKATSGRPGTTSKDQNLKNTGPIPEGKYTLDPKEISEVNGFAYYRRFLSPLSQGRLALADWGNFRVPLHPSEYTNTFGRNGFFLHGGLYPGSAGCIDVGEYDHMLFNGFNGLSWHDGTIKLEVRYDE